MKISNNKENNRFVDIVSSVKKFCQNKIVPVFKKVYSNRFLFAALSALLINSIIEITGRGSIVAFCNYVINSFHFFVFSTAIILLTFCIPMFFKHRLFVHTICSYFWLAFGIANAVFLTYRSTPVLAIDLMILRASLAVSTLYVSILPFIIVPLVAAILIGFLVFIYKKVKDQQVNYKFSAITACSTAVFITALVAVFQFTNAVPSYLRLPEVYDKCGYTYCFVYSFLDYGVDSPETYNKEYIENIKKELNKVEEKVPEEKPNIIMVQLESFMDMSRLEGINLSENPHPFYTQLKENYPSGSMQVNAVGACTANIEFEVLTGTYIKDYGFDEYPYETFLNKKPIETIAYDLKALGYSTTSMHNHDAAFYSRNKAYSNLGFDCFIPREAMSDVEYTPTGWAKDEILIKYISEALNKSESEDFIFAVSVQCHSKYPKERLTDFNYNIEVTGSDDEEYTNMLSYYAMLMVEEDKFIESLVNYLYSYDEKTILVLYGDHLPTFIKSSEQLNDADTYTDDGLKYISEYVIWSNYDISAEDIDLKALELSSTVLDYAGIHTGNVMKLYQADISDDTLKDYRLALTYDIVEGHHYINDGVNPYVSTDLKIGLYPQTITGFEAREDGLYVYGSNYTKDTKVYINDRLYSTSYLSDNILRVNEQVKLVNNDRITVAMVTFDLVQLVESEEFIVNGLNEELVVNKGKYSAIRIMIHCFIAVCIIVTICVTVFVFNKIKKKKANYNSSCNSTRNS